MVGKEARITNLVVGKEARTTNWVVGKEARITNLVDGRGSFCECFVGSQDLFDRREDFFEIVSCVHDEGREREEVRNYFANIFFMFQTCLKVRV